jgi:hypothetical protein
MAPERTIAALFTERPWQWGLRGDPYLWDELAQTLASHAFPETEAELVALLEQTYRHLTGVPLTAADPVYVERYSHGGMSSGQVSPRFWIETAIPLLCARFRDRSSLARLGEIVEEG